jgi:predicted RNase H-like nuclease
MPIIAGVDGCPAGWICITQQLKSGKLQSAVHTTARGLIHQVPKLDILAVDIPIGLGESGPRLCDQLARGMLKSRGCCVFPAPVRPAINAKTREDASRINRNIDGRGVGCQAWNIYPKIREVDQLMLADPALQHRVFEVHPELSFAEWNKSPILDRKKSIAGLAARRALIDRHFGPAAFDSIRAQHARSDVQSDDIADAFAALWTAVRIAAGAAISLPTPSPVDSEGLHMRITF